MNPMNGIGRTREVPTETPRLDEVSEEHVIVEESVVSDVPLAPVPHTQTLTSDDAFTTLAGQDTPPSQRRLQALGAKLRASLSDSSVSEVDRSRLMARLRGVREALNANDESLEAWGRIAQEVTTLARAIAAQPKLSDPTLRDDFIALRDTVLRTAAQHFDLRLIETAGQVRDVEPTNSERSREAARIAQSLLAQTTMAWVAHSAAPSQRKSAIHLLHSLQQLNFAYLTANPPPPIESTVPPRPGVDRQIGQDLYWSLDELFRTESPLEPALIDDLMSIVRELEVSEPGEAVDAIADALNIPDDVLNDTLERLGVIDAPDVSAPERGQRLRRPTSPVTNGVDALAPPGVSGVNAGTIPNLPTLNERIRPLDFSDATEPSRVLFDVIAAAPSGTGPQVANILDAYRGASRAAQALAPPFSFETQLPVPLVYTDDDGNAFFLPAGAQIRGDNDGGLIAETDGFLIRTSDSLVIANGGEFRLGGPSDGVLAERLVVATESTDVFMTGFAGTIDRDGPVAVLGADRVRVNTTEDGRDTRIEFDGARIIQTSPEQLALEADRLLYATDSLYFSGSNARLEEETTAERSRFSLALEQLDLVSESEALQSDSLSLRTVQNADGSQEAVFDLVGVTLQSGSDDVALDSAELRFVGSIDGRARYELQTSSLQGKLGGFDVNAQGTSSLLVELNGDGTLHTVTLGNPNTVLLAKDDERLAVTGGSFGLSYDEAGSSVINIAAIKAEYEQLPGADGQERWLNVELGKLTLTQDENGVGELQVTGQVLNGTYDDLSLSGGDVGLLVGLGEDGRAESVSATGRSLTIGDGVNTLIAHEASLEVDLDNRGRFTDLTHQTGMTEISSSEVGTFTLTGNSGLSLDYDGDYLSRIEADTEQLAFTHADGGQLDLRGAVGVIELDRNSAPSRAELTTGALSWRGTDGVEISSFGAGGEIEFSPDGGILAASAGVEGMTVGTNGGVAQIERGTLSARYGEDGSFRSATIAAERGTYYTNSGQFQLDRGQLALDARDDGGTHATLQFEQVEFERGGETIFLSHSNVELVQDAEGNAQLDGVFGAASVTTDRGSFTLAPGTTLEADLDANEGLTAFAGTVDRGTYRTGDDRITIADAEFDGSFSEGELVAFDATGAVAYNRDGGISIDTPRAAIALTALEDGGSELIVSGDDLRATDRGRQFVGEGTTELAFVLNDEGEVQSARARADRFSVIDGDLRYAFDDNEVGIAEDGDIHLLNGRAQVFDGGEQVAELVGTDALIDFDETGRLTRVQLLNENAYLSGDFGTLRAVENAGGATFHEGRLVAIDVTNGAMALDLESGLAIQLERSQANLTYDENFDPTLTISSGRGLLEGDFGRLTLPEGFWLRARQEEGTTLLDGATPNATLERDSGLLAVNSFELAMRLGPEGFEHLSATGSAHFDHPERAARLRNGALSIDYDRASDRLTYRGTADSFSLRDGEFFMHPEQGSNQVELGDSFKGALSGSVFELNVQGDAFESVRFDNATADIQVFDSSSEELHSLTLKDQTFTLVRETDGSTRMNLGLGNSEATLGANALGLGGTQIGLDGATSVAVHLTPDGRLAEGDGLVALMPGTIRVRNDEAGLNATLTGTSLEA
ncbi:MAG: hypothetical protein AAF658_01055, partial [Myxococcota bacterium]